MTPERERIVEGLITATRVLKLQCSVETLAQAVVRLSAEYQVRLEEAEEVLAGMEKRKAA